MHFPIRALLALVCMINEWRKSTDGTGSSIAVVAFDFKKAFDIINNDLLVEKFERSKYPLHRS